MPKLHASNHLPPNKPLSFQRHSRTNRLTICVFIDILDFLASFLQWSFVSNNIRASFVHFPEIRT